MITQKQKELLEKELKEIKVSYVIGVAVGLLFGVVAYFALRYISDISLFGIEEFFTGSWRLIWAALVFLLTFLKWINGNRLAERRKEIELKLAEQIAG